MKIKENEIEIYIDELDMGWDKSCFTKNFNGITNTTISDIQWKRILESINWDEIKEMVSELTNFDYDLNDDDELYLSTFDSCFGDVMSYLQSINDEILEKG